MARPSKNFDVPNNSWKGPLLLGACPTNLTFFGTFSSIDFKFSPHSLICNVYSQIPMRAPKFVLKFMAAFLKKCSVHLEAIPLQIGTNSTISSTIQFLFTRFGLLHEHVELETHFLHQTTNQQSKLFLQRDAFRCFGTQIRCFHLEFR